jgi:hypothetical protein
MSPKILSLLFAELAAWCAAKDKREWLICRVERWYDEVIAPVDLPGPDRVLDPAIRVFLRPLVGRVYDVLTYRWGQALHVATQVEEEHKQ